MMARYLLSAQAVLHICMRQGKPAETWLQEGASKKIARQDVCISAVTPMSVLRTIDDEILLAKGVQGDPRRLPALSALRQNVLRFVEDLASEDRIVPMDHLIAERWGTLLDAPITYTLIGGGTRDLGGAEKLEIATAIVGREGISFVYLTEAQDAYQYIPQLITETP